MDQPKDEEQREWAKKIDALRVELGILSRFTHQCWKESKVTWDDYVTTLKAFNDVFRRAGTPTAVIRDGDKLTVPQPDDAMTYAFYRDGLHQLRKKFLELHPELESELDLHCPRQRTR